MQPRVSIAGTINCRHKTMTANQRSLKKEDWGETFCAFMLLFKLMTNSNPFFALQDLSHSIFKIPYKLKWSCVITFSERENAKTHGEVWNQINLFSPDITHSVQARSFPREENSLLTKLEEGIYFTVSSLLMILIFPKFYDLDSRHCYKSDPWSVSFLGSLC